MKTLSAANQANIANRVQTPVIKIDLTNQSKKWSYGDADGYDPVIQSISPISQSIDPYGGIGSYSSFNFSIQKEFGTNQIIQTDELDNEPVTVAVAYGSDPDITVIKGTVDAWEYAKGILTIYCISQIGLKGKTLPIQQINVTNYTTENIPETSLNKWVPFTIGSGYKPLGHTLDYGENASTAQVIFNTAVSGHAAIGNLTLNPSFYVWDQLQTWWKEGELAVGDQVGSGSLTAGRLDFDTLGTFDDIFLMLETDLIPSRAEWTSGSGTNPGNALDGSTSTYAELDNPASDGVTTGGEYRALIPEFTGNTWDITALYFIVKVEKENAVNHGVRTAEKFHIAFEIITGTTPVLADQTNLLASGTTFNNVDGADSRLGKQLTLTEYTKAWGKNADTTDGFFPVDKLSRRWLNIECIEEDLAGGGDESDYFRIHYVSINPGVSIVFPVRWGIHGNLSGYDDDGSGTYTGSANSLIETPCDVAYFILGKIWGLSGFNTASLTTARTGFGTYIIGGQFLDLTDGESALTEILNNSRMSVWVDYNDQWKFKYWDLPAVTPDKTFSQNNADFVGDEVVSVSQSPSENLYNQFEILYSFSVAEQRYTNQLILDESTAGAIGTWLTSSQADYNITRKLVIECPWINDDDTATSFGNYLIYRYADRKRVVQFQTGFNGLEMELLDRVQLTHQDLTDTDESGGGNHDYEIYSIETDVVNGIITFEAMQADVPNAALTDPT